MKFSIYLNRRVFVMVEKFTQICTVHNRKQNERTRRNCNRDPALEQHVIRVLTSVFKQGCVQLSETFTVTLKQFSAEGSEYPQTSLKLSFGTTKPAYPHIFFFLCFFVTIKYGTVNWVDIIHLILYEIDNY